MNELREAVEELASANTALKTQVEKIFGKIETTDFADEYAALVSVQEKISNLVKNERIEDAPPADAVV